MPLDDILIDAEMHMEKANDHLLHELRGIRTGRATPALVEHIKVDYYGSPTDLRSIASISVPEATQILIKPFSPGDLRDRKGDQRQQDRSDPPQRRQNASTDVASLIAGTSPATRRTMQANGRDRQDRHSQRPA